MEDAIQALLSEQNESEVIDRALETIQNACLEKPDSAPCAANALTDFLEKRQQSCNAKLRRKVGRLVDRLLSCSVATLEQPTDVTCVEKSFSEVTTKEDFASALRNSTSREDIEGIVIQISAFDFENYPKSALLEIIKSLDVLLDNESITLNSKLRRRIKRLSQDMSDIVTKTLSSTAIANDLAESEPVVVRPLPIPEVTRLLQAASSISDVTAALNCMDLSNLREGIVSMVGPALFCCNINIFRRH